jgi:hypothetical protein
MLSTKKLLLRYRPDLVKALLLVKRSQFQCLALEHHPSINQSILHNVASGMYFTEKIPQTGHKTKPHKTGECYNIENNRKEKHTGDQTVR